MKRYSVHIIVFCFLVLLLVLVQYFKPIQHRWIPTLANNDKNPYGAYILFHELKSIFPNQQIIESRVLISELDLKTKANTYLIILPEMQSDSIQALQILDFAEKGNTVFISAERFSESFLKPFGLGFKFDAKILAKADTTLYFCNPSILYPDFWITGDGNPSFVIVDSVLPMRSVIKSRTGVLKMLRCSYGSGEVLLSTMPLMFSNYSLLEPHSKVAAIALSHLPKTGTVIWDEYFKQGRNEVSSPLRYILKNRSTRWAYILTLFGILLFLLFQIKRIRSIVPVVEPFKNTSLQFLKAVALLHYDQRDYSDIARKKINYFLEFIRQKWHCSTDNLNEDFVQQLASKTAYPYEETANIISLINQILKQGANKNTLIDLNKKIEEFLKKSSTKI